MHKMTLNSIKEKKEKQYQQQSQKERDAVYARMLHNLERTRAMVRNTISRASTILAEEYQMTLTEADFHVIKSKMNKIDQRLNMLYQNWQVEYKGAVTTEECEEIRKFYKPYLEKYESKYRILYKILQVSKEPTRLLPPEEPTSEITPSLAALDDAPALKQKEWRRGEPGEDIPQQYSPISGCLTLTPPRYKDMRMDLTLNVTPEGSLCDLPAAVGGTEETAETPKTQLKVATERGPTQVESPRRIKRTREGSREDAITSTGHFFATVNRQNETTTELPAETTTATDVSGGNAHMNTPVISSAPIETETTEGETRSPRTFLPNGSPSRPTATATCRPQMWVQHDSEGQINEPTREGEDSGESNPSEPYVLVEGIPDELGHEWRVLHPFEIPGVRFPTDNTPPNQRRLAENDALVELIQTTKYLEDTPTWGERDYRLYPLRYGDPFYRGRGRGRGRGRRDWLSERPFERETNGGPGRGFFHGSGRGTA